MKKFLVLLGAIGILLFSSQAQATILSGSIADWPESTVRSWGDGVHNINMVWSTRHESGGDGWFCGMNCSGEQNANLFVYSNFTNPLSIADASLFTYLPDNVYAFEGDTLFYRSLEGYYGAFIIDDIYPDSQPGAPYTFLTGRWYFQDDGTGNFGGGQQPTVPEPASLSLLGLGLLGLMGLRKKRS